VNEKTIIIPNFILFMFLIVFFCASFGAGYYIGTFICGTNPADSGGVESNIAKERELLERIGEYQRREEERNRREAERIAAERVRIERTETAIGAIRGLDRQSGSLLQELKQEAQILADYFRGSCDILNNDLNNPENE
jgi:hypothetical protein